MGGYREEVTDHTHLPSSISPTPSRCASIPFNKQRQDNILRRDEGDLGRVSVTTLHCSSRGAADPNAELISAKELDSSPKSTTGLKDKHIAVIFVEFRRQDIDEKCHHRWYKGH